MLDGNPAAGCQQGSVGQLVQQCEGEGPGAEGGAIGRVDVDGVESAMLFAKVGQEVLGFCLVQFGSMEMPVPHQPSDVAQAPAVSLVQGESCPPAVGLQPYLAAASTKIEEGLSHQVGAEHGEEGLLEPGGGDVDGALSAGIEGDRPPLEGSGYDAQSHLPFREVGIMELAAGGVKDEGRKAPPPVDGSRGSGNCR